MCSIFALFSTLFFITFFLDSFNALITSSHIIKAISIRMVYRVDLVPEHYIGFRITGVNRLVIKKTTHHTTKITSRATVVSEKWCWIHWAYCPSPFISSSIFFFLYILLCNCYSSPNISLFTYLIIINFFNYYSVCFFFFYPWLLPTKDEKLCQINICNCFVNIFFFFFFFFGGGGGELIFHVHILWQKSLLYWLNH